MSSIESRDAAGLARFKMLPHDDQGPQLNFTIWLLAILSFGFLALRIYCKFIRRRGLWWDDYVLVAAWVRLYYACCICPARPFPAC